jgi:hypothetical protein
MDYNQKPMKEPSKERGLTQKERALVGSLAEGKNLTQSALAAGYSSKHPGQSGWQALQNIRLKLPELLDQHGLTDSVLIEKHLKPLLLATETKFFQHKGKVTDTRVVPAHAIRLNALDMTLRLKGSYAPAQSEQATKTVSCIVLDIPRPPRPGINPSENGHHKKDVKGAAMQMVPAKAHPPDGHPHAD